MKKLLTTILLCAQASLLLSPAYAHAAEVSTAVIDDGHEEAVLYLPDDGTYTQYVIRNAQFVFNSAGQCILTGELESDGSAVQMPVSDTVNTAPPVETAEAYFSEGVDTTVEIIGYTEYGGHALPCFLSDGDRIAVISPAGIPSWEQT